MRYRHRFQISALLLAITLNVPTASAEDLDSQPAGAITVTAEQDSVSIVYQIPSTVLLKIGDTIFWSVNRIVLQDSYGNVSENLVGIQNSKVEYSLELSGRKSTLFFATLVAGVYTVDVSAKVGAVTHSISQEIEFQESMKRPRDNLLSKLNITQFCPESLTNGKVECDFAVTVETLKDFPIPVFIEKRIDQGSWKRISVLKVMTNSVQPFKVSASSKENFSIRSYGVYKGIKYYSGAQNWMSTAGSIIDQSELIARELRDSCKDIPKTINVKFIKTGYFGYKELVAQYRVNGVFDLVLSEDDSLWIFKADPISGKNKTIATKWQCGAGGPGAVLRIYLVPK